MGEPPEAGARVARKSDQGAVGGRPYTTHGTEATALGAPISSREDTADGVRIIARLPASERDRYERFRVSVRTPIAPSGVDAR